MKHTTLAALMFALTSATLSFAQTTTPPSKPAKPDMRVEMDKHWEQADTDKDGFLSKTEAQAAMNKKFEEHFAKLDTNKDGKLSKDEMKAGRHMMGHHSDKDKAGSQHQAGAMNHGSDRMNAKLEERFKKSDTNNDGFVTKDELKAAGHTRALDRFDDIDGNKDGKLTLLELQTTMEKYRSLGMGVTH